MNEKLIIDLAKCKLQEESGVRCSYKHHPENKGFDSLLEMIRFALVCRRCEGAPCIKACPRKALEKIHITQLTPGPVPGAKPCPQVAGLNKIDAGILKRANMLCTGCGTCAIACPFGTIYTDLIPFPSSVCDVCRGRLQPGEKPLCVQTCRDGSIDYGKVTIGRDLMEVFDCLVVRVPSGILWEPFLRGSEKAKK
jgi:Fe-S-cluster-containing dehydrogenase component